jgi:hypothetical protein
VTYFRQVCYWEPNVIQGFRRLRSGAIGISGRYGNGAPIRHARLDAVKFVCNAAGKPRFRGQPLQHDEILPSMSLASSGK